MTLRRREIYPCGRLSRFMILPPKVGCVRRQSVGGSVGRSRIRMLVTLFIAVCATSCTLMPSDLQAGSDRQHVSRAQEHGRAAAQQLLDTVVERMLRDNRGSFGADVVFGGVMSNIKGEYSIRASRARLRIDLTRLHRDTWHSFPKSFEVILVGDTAYVRSLSSLGAPTRRWVQVSKRHIYADLPCWPSAQRRLPDRTLMLLSNAEAVGFDPERRFVIVATVPARLIAGVFADPALAEELLRAGLAPIEVRIGQFRGRLTTFELEGKSVGATLRQAGVPLDRRSVRRLKSASYRVSFGHSDDLATLVHPPRASSALHPGHNLELPPPPRLCRTASV